MAVFLEFETSENFFHLSVPKKYSKNKRRYILRH